MGWKSKCHKAKVLHRPYLKGDWCKEKLHSTFPAYSNDCQYNMASESMLDVTKEFPGSAEPTEGSALSCRIVSERGVHGKDQQRSAGSTPVATAQEVGRCHQHLTSPIPQLPIYVDRNSLSAEDFNGFYQECNVPAIVRGVMEEEKWPCREGHWTLSSLREKIGKDSFKCGEDDDGDAIKLKLKHFVKYLRSNEDDSPLYIFDSSHLDKFTNNCISNGYKPPEYFQDDLFEYVGEKRRPPYKWFLVGPERSGTTVHIDPLHTSAWNTVVVGKKRWVLFPPGVRKKVVKGSGLWKDGEDDEAANYFMKVREFSRVRWRDDAKQVVLCSVCDGSGSSRLFVQSSSSVTTRAHCPLNPADKTRICCCQNVLTPLHPCPGPASHKVQVPLASCLRIHSASGRNSIRSVWLVARRHKFDGHSWRDSELLQRLQFRQRLARCQRRQKEDGSDVAGQAVRR